MVPRRQGKERSQPGHGGHHVRRADGHVGAGRRLHRQRTARVVEGRGQPRLQLEPVPDRRYAYYNTGFGLVPIGGLDTPTTESQVLGQSFGSTRQSLFKRPQHSVSANANYFREVLGTSHEFKFGGDWQRADAVSNTLWPGNRHPCARKNSATDYRARRIYREALRQQPRRSSSTSYVGDTIVERPPDAGPRRPVRPPVGMRTRRAVAVERGVSRPRAGHQRSPGTDSPFTWNNVSPRVGVTYALDNNQRTIACARASAATPGSSKTGSSGSQPERQPATSRCRGWTPTAITSRRRARWIRAASCRSAAASTRRTRRR